jgi:hypothetical protein
VKKLRTLNPAVKAANRELIGEGRCFRVVYVNRMDGSKRVFIGSLTNAEANAVLARWGSPGNPSFYMGPETAIERCDGTPDGAILAGEAELMRQAEKLAEARLGMA